VSPLEDIRPDVVFPTGKRKGRQQLASIYWPLNEHE
jgi:hypothetical protein